MPNALEVNDEVSQINSVSAVTGYLHAADWSVKPLTKVQIDSILSSDHFPETIFFISPPKDSKSAG